MSSGLGELVVAGRPAATSVEAALVVGGFVVRISDEATVDRVYLDTFDGLLYAAGLALRWERGRLELLEAEDGVPRETAAYPEPVGPLPVAQLPTGQLRDALAAVVEVRALLPKVRVRVVIRTLAILDDLDKTVARMIVAVPALVGGGRQIPLRTRVCPIPVRGYDRELALAHSLVSRELGFAGADCTLFEEAVRAAGERPEGVSAKVDVPLRPDQRAEEAVVAVLERLLEIIDANLPGTIRDIDPEFLHDYRVSIRRTRSVQRECRGVFPPGELALMRAQFRWLQQVTGNARDLDVYVLGFESMRALVPDSMQADLDPLASVLANRRLLAHREMIRQLESHRASALRADWGDLLAGLPAMPLEERPDATRPIADLAAERIRKVYRRMVKMGRAIGPDSPPEDYHELRKKGKELRYLLELFGQPLHDPDVVKPMIKALKGLQDVLGHHQDREVQMASVWGMREEVAPLPSGPAALMAMGVLIDRLQDDAREARTEFTKVFDAFASKEQRSRIKAMF